MTMLALVCVLAYSNESVAATVPARSIPGNASSVIELLKQTDGKLVLVGQTQICNAECSGGIAVIRYLASGRLDRSFGGGDGIALGPRDRRIGRTLSFKTAEIAPGGEIVLGGDDRRDFKLVRFTRDGVLDASFGGDGSVTTDFGSRDDLTAISIAPNGEVIAAGSTTGGPAAGEDFALSRYRTDGSLDPEFGSDGIVTTDFTSSSSTTHDGALAVTISSNGDIVAAGGTQSCPEGAKCFTAFSLARYEENGTLDSSFGNDGRVDFTVVLEGFGSVISSSVPFSSANQILLKSDGKIVLGGSGGYYGYKTVSQSSAFAQYSPDGTPDSSFGGGDGEVFGACREAGFIAEMPEGFTSESVECRDKIGSSGSIGPLALFRARGAVGAFLPYVDSLSPTRILRGGIVRAEQSNTGAEITSFAVARYFGDRTLDEAFATNGVAVTPELPRCHGATATLLGTDRSDRLIGSNRADVIFGGRGDDLVFSFANEDLVCSGAGDDTLYLGANRDVALAGSGADVVFGGDGPDQLLGQSGTDLLRGDRGVDILFGGPGRDTVLQR